MPRTKKETKQDPAAVVTVKYEPTNYGVIAGILLDIVDAIHEADNNTEKWKPIRERIESLLIE
jgi:hypothetical protein